MPLHMAYHPESHGYYYLKPYNYQHLPVHQEFAASFGGDPRNPYDTSLLDDLGGEFHADGTNEVSSDGWRTTPSVLSTDSMPDNSDTSDPFGDNDASIEELSPGEPVDAN